MNKRQLYKINHSLWRFTPVEVALISEGAISHRVKKKERKEKEMDRLFSFVVCKNVTLASFK